MNHTLDDVRQWAPNDLYEKAAIMASSHPGVRLHQKIADNLPLYLRRRAAAAAYIAQNGPNAIVPARVNPSASPYDPPAPSTRCAAVPTEAETLALSKRIAPAVKQLHELAALRVDSAQLQADFRAAVWTGGMIEAWAAWTSALVARDNRQAERLRVERYLGLNLSEDYAASALIHPGQFLPPTAGYPTFLDELALALQVAPPAPTKKAA